MPKISEYDPSKNIIRSYTIVVDPERREFILDRFKKKPGVANRIYHHKSDFKLLREKYLRKHNSEIERRIIIRRDLIPVSRSSWLPEDKMLVHDFHKGFLSKLIPFVICTEHGIQNNPFDGQAYFATDTTDYNKNVKAGVIETTRLQCAELAFMTGSYELLCKIATPSEIRTILSNYKLRTFTDEKATRGLIERANKEHRMLQYIRHESNIFSR